MTSAITVLPKKKISELIPHPKNIEIYGANESIVDLVENIQKSGWVSPLTITQNCVIISGHRRHRACQQLGIKEVEVIVKQYDNDIDIVEALVLDNKQREKTNLQKANEAEALLIIERTRADERKKAGIKVNLTAESPYGKQKGESRDIVAEQVGFKSGREVERAVAAAKVIKEAEKTGDTEKAEILKGQLERSPATAERLAYSWDKVESSEIEKHKEGLKSGKLSANGLVDGSRKIKEKSSIDKTVNQTIKELKTEGKKLGRIAFIMGGVGTLSNAIEQVSSDLKKHLHEIVETEERNQLKEDLQKHADSILKLITLI